MRSLILIAIFSITSAVAAEAAYTIDFTQILLDNDGKPIPYDPKDNSPATLGAVASTALDTMISTEQNVTGEEKFHRGLLAARIKNDKAAVLSVEDLALVKKLIGEVYGPLVVAPAWMALDPSLQIKKQ